MAQRRVSLDREPPAGVRRGIAGPRESEEELTARVSAEVRRALLTLAITAAVGVALGLLLR